VVAKIITTKKLVRMGQDDMLAADAEKVIFPFLQVCCTSSARAKMNILRRNLESLKKSLHIMLSVLSFAENITAKTKR
jgi:hypothetical protein